MLGWPPGRDPRPIGLNPITLVIVNPLWTSLSAREGMTAFALRQVVPASLEDELRDWIYRAVSRLPDDGKRLMIRLGLVVPDGYVREHAHAYARYEEKVRERAQLIEAEAAAAKEAEGHSSSTALMPSASSISRYPFPMPPPDPRVRFLAYGTPVELLLYVIDGVLDLLLYKPAPPATTDPVLQLVRRARKAVRNKDQREILQQLLDDGHPIYRVRSDGRGLERRASLVANAQAITATDAAEEAGFAAAGDRLIAAWHSIYALKPDASGAYRDAIRAVEAVDNPFFLPNAPAPTLGQVIRHLEDHGSDYGMVIAGKTNEPADVSAMIGIMRLLWEGHRDRHEGGRTSAAITLESAEAAVSIAVSLVQLLSTGAIRSAK